MTTTQPDQHTRTVVNPATGQAVAEVPDLCAEDVSVLVQRAREAQPAWNDLGFAARGKLLKSLNRWLIEHKDEVIGALSQETGKSYDDALRTDVMLAAQSIGYWATHAQGHLKEVKVPVSAVMFGKKVSVRYEPLGVVGVIAPWNYPILVAVADVMPALMAGNTVVVKPSEFSPLATRLFFETGMRAVGFPEGVCQVATGAGETGAALVEAVDMVQFTGSAATGRKILARAGERLIPASAELGGKDPLIVLADANLERAANCAIQWGICNSGQTCVGTERIYVEAPVHDAFVDLVVEKVNALRQGAPGAAASVEVGAMTTDTQVDIVQRHVEEAVASGARVLTGGHRGTGTGRFFEPTVLVDVRNDMACMQEETFGPTLPIMRVADAEEAVLRANDSPYGLNASVFTKDLRKGAQIARRLEAGQVCVNDAAVSISAFGAPMSGWKQSGVGGRHGDQGIRKYCASQTVMIAHLALAREPYMYPYTEKRTKVIDKLLTMLFAR